MHVGILQKWEGDRTFTLLFQAPQEKEEACKTYLQRLKKEAHDRNLPVEYKMVQLDGEMNADLAKQEERKKIIVPQGRYKGLEILLEKDNDTEEV